MILFPEPAVQGPDSEVAMSVLGEGRPPGPPVFKPSRALALQAPILIPP